MRSIIWKDFSAAARATISWAAITLVTDATASGASAAASWKTAIRADAA